MKLILTLMFVACIALSGCKTTPAPQENQSLVDTAMLTKTEFVVNGMHCNGCENTVKSNVGEIPGVSSVEASFKEHKAIVWFDSTKTNAVAIVSAIENDGYKVDTFMRK